MTEPIGFKLTTWDDMETPNDGELYRMIKDIRETIEKHHIENTKSHVDMITQQKITNGRVTSLERWQSFIMGGLAILGVLVIPIVLKLVLQ